MSWIEDLAEGDAVIVDPHLDKPWRTVVVRLTKTMVMVHTETGAELRFWRSTGRLVAGGDWDTARLAHVTDRHALARLRKGQADRWRRWVAANIGKVPDGQVKSLVAAMKEAMREGDS